MPHSQYYKYNQNKKKIKKLYHKMVHIILRSMKHKLLALLLIISLSLWTVQFSYANKTLQSRMEKVYLQHQWKVLLKQQVKSSDKWTDLHMTSLKIARQHALIGIHQSIEKIIADFRFISPSCALSYDDASVLLVQNKQFKRFLNRIKEIDSDFSYSLDSSSFPKACVKYLNCRNPWSKLGNTLSADDYVSCTQGIAEKFTESMTLNMADNQLSNYSYGDEIFDNGSLDDSSFDIAYDIEQIHKILFANPKRIRSFYLRWPPSYLSKQNNDIQNNQIIHSYANNTILIPSKLYAGNELTAPNIEDAIKQIKSSQDEWSTITSNLQCFDPAPIITSDPAKEFKKELKKINNDSLNMQEEQLIDDVIGTISQPYEDEPPVPTITALPPEISNPLSDIQVEERNGDQPNSTGNSNIGSITTQNDCPSTPPNLTEQFDIKDTKKTGIIACLKKCSSCWDGFFKKSCYAGCLCSKFVNDVTDSSMFWLTIGTRLCLVPSTTPDMITPGTQVVSIQEIINQLAATIGKLKESWQYIPSSKPSEFFSPTTKIGKLSNLLNFNLTIRSASKYKKPNTKNEETSIREYYDTQIPDEAQLQIGAIISQQDNYSKLLSTHIEFRDKMNSILWWFRDAMKSFAATQNGASK